MCRGNKWEYELHRGGCEVSVYLWTVNNNVPTEKGGKRGSSARLHMVRSVIYLPLSVTEKTSRKPSPVLMYCSLMAPNSSCPAVSRTRKHIDTHTCDDAHTHRQKNNLFNNFFKCSLMPPYKWPVSVRLYLYMYSPPVFVLQSALTVKPGRPFVNHTLLCVGVFNCGIIVGDKVRLQRRKSRTKRGKKGNLSMCVIHNYVMIKQKLHPNYKQCKPSFTSTHMLLTETSYLLKREKEHCIMWSH